MGRIAKNGSFLMWSVLGVIQNIHVPKTFYPPDSLTIGIIGIQDSDKSWVVCWETY